MIDVSNGWDVSVLVETCQDCSEGDWGITGKVCNVGKIINKDEGDLNGFGEAFNAVNINDFDSSVVLTGIVVLLEELDKPKTVWFIS